MEENKITEVAENATVEPVETKTEAPEKTFTQTQVDEIVTERLKKQEKKLAEKYSNYFSKDDVADLNNQLSEIGNSLKVANDKTAEDAQTIAGLESKLKQYETDSAKIRIALEVGVPYELANKLSGDSEEELKADAQKMASFMRPTTSMPLRNPEANAEVDGVLAAFKQLNPNLKI